MELVNSNQAMDLSLSSMDSRPTLSLQVNTTASSSSFMMSPPSECELTPRPNTTPNNATSTIALNGTAAPALKQEVAAADDDDDDEQPLVMSFPDEENTVNPYQEMVGGVPATCYQEIARPKIQPVKTEFQEVSSRKSPDQLSPNWNDGCGMLHLLAMAADIRSNCGQKQLTNQSSSSSHVMPLSNENSPTFYNGRTEDISSSISEKSKATELTTSNESSPTTPSEDFSPTEYSSNSGHTAISAVSAATSVSSSRANIPRRRGSEHPYFRLFLFVTVTINPKTAFTSP